MSVRGKAELFLFSCTLIWGGTFVVVKEGLRDLSPLLFVALRFAIATVLLFPFVASGLRRIRRRALEGGIVIGVLLFIGFATQTVGLGMTTASKSGFITGLLVVFTPVFQTLIERKPPKTGNVIGVIVVTAGLLLLTSPEGSSFNLGDVLTLFCAAVFGLYIVYLDIYTREENVWHIAFLQSFVTMVGAGISAALFETPMLSLTTGAIGAIAYLSLLATVYTLTVQTRFQKDTTPTRAAIIFSIEPVFAAVFAYLFLGEMIGMLGIVGGGLVVTGLLISEISDILFKSGAARR